MFCNEDSPKAAFPFLFGGTFIEGHHLLVDRSGHREFPFLFGGTFIEGRFHDIMSASAGDFPSFSEGLSLRDHRD